MKYPFFASLVLLGLAAVSARGASMTSTRMVGSGWMTIFPQDHSPPTTKPISFNESDVHTNGASSSADQEQVVEEGYLHAFGTAKSFVGSLHSDITGATATSSSAGAHGYVSSSRYEASATASWQDTFTIDGLFFGQTIYVNGNINLSGSLSERFDHDALTGGSGFAVVEFSGTGMGFVSGVKGERTDPPTKLNTPPPGNIPVVILATAGIPQQVSFSLTARVSGAIQSDLFAQSAHSSGAILTESDFSHTATWGGITSITDATTGATLAGWSIRSDSGFDYTLPYPVPEPLMSTLLIPVVVVLGLRHRGRAMP